MRIDWDRETLVLVQRGGVYARMARVGDVLLCCFERRGGCWVRRSGDEGKTWQEPIKVVEYEFGHAANPEFLVCRDGRVLLFYNGRPNNSEHPFTIGMAVSQNEGTTWVADAKPLFAAGNVANSGCYEPAAIQLPSGEIQLFFANEFPYRNGDQEISIMRSADGGKTWSASTAVSYRRKGRDGMPVPVMLRDGKGIAVAIEDNGLTRADHQLKPAVIMSPEVDGWTGPAALGDSPRRWAAVEAGFPVNTYAGAPYFRQLLTGETLLSCQSDKGVGHPRMVVYVGDSEAKHFDDPSEPFVAATNSRGMWNSLFVKDRSTVTALSTTTIGGVAGVWAIDGRVIRQ